jgi:putative endonuclease
MGQYRRQLGNWAENIVCTYIQRAQYQIVARQWHCRYGEIDVIAKDPDGDLVFFEVRAKASDAFGRPEESIGLRKRRTLARIISWYVQEQQYMGGYRCDVCAIERRNGKIHLRHLKNVRLE